MKPAAAAMATANKQPVTQPRTWRWQLAKYAEYSGLWMGVALNPWHWQWGLHDCSGHWQQQLQFKFSCHLGPLWLRVIVDHGRW